MAGAGGGWWGAMGDVWRLGVAADGVAGCGGGEDLSTGWLRPGGGRISPTYSPEIARRRWGLLSHLAVRG